MKVNFSFIKREIGTYYRKEFFFWIFSVLFLGISLFFSVREVKKFSALKESYDRIERSYLRVQPEVVRLKEVLKEINWEREFKKEEIPLVLEIDLTNLKSSFNTLETLTSPSEDTFFSLKEMTLSKREDKKPLLIIKGIKIIYR